LDGCGLGLAAMDIIQDCLNFAYDFHCNMA